MKTSRGNVELEPPSTESIQINQEIKNTRILRQLIKKHKKTTFSA